MVHVTQPHITILVHLGMNFEFVNIPINSNFNSSNTSEEAYVTLALSEVEPLVFSENSELFSSATL